METLFLDAGYIIGLEAEDDQHHQTAINPWQNLSENLPPIVTTTYIFDEVLTFFRSRNRHAKAVEIGNNLLESDLIDLIQVDEALFQAGWEFFKQHQDKTFLLTDCISFVVMKERKIKSALSFDKHFRQAGFKTLSK
jgi:uncharacterized protein